MTFQHRSFGARFHERTPGVCAAIVDVEFEAVAALEHGGKFASDLAGYLEERGRMESVCICSEGMRKMVLVDGVSQLCGQIQQSAGVLAGHAGLECWKLSTCFAVRIDMQVTSSDVQVTAT